MSAPLPHATLKAKQRELRQGFPETMGLRVHRSISWIGRAEAAADDDARFIFLWIAFNAAYADEQEFQGPAPGERAAFADFFGKMVRLDAERRIYNEIWEGFAGPIRVLMQNRYVFNPFWQHHNGIEGYEDWGREVQGVGRRLRPVLRRAGYRPHPELRLRQALRPAQPTRTWRRDLEQLRESESGARWSLDTGLPHARLRRRHDGETTRGLGTTLLSRREVERPAA